MSRHRRRMSHRRRKAAWLRYFKRLYCVTDHYGRDDDLANNIVRRDPQMVDLIARKMFGRKAWIASHVDV